MILIFIGILLVVFACLSKKKAVDNEESYFNADMSVRLVRNAISDANDTIERLNKLSSDTLEKFENKYQELLFLYQMIDDMKEKRSETGLDDYQKGFNFQKDEKSGVSKNPNYDRIKNMRENGFSISEISKALNMGQSEIKLILEIGKAR